MSNIIQHAVILNSQNRLRTAGSLAREWAIAHAGAYQGQATRELGGSESFREWTNDSLSIRFAKLTTESFKQVQLFSVNYDLADSSEPYAAYVMTYTAPALEQAGGYCIAVASVPDSLGNAQLPWDEKAGPAGLEQFVETIKSDRLRPSKTDRTSTDLASIDDLFTIHDSALVLTERGLEGDEFQELADMHSEWAAVVAITASQQLTFSDEIQDHQLRSWNRARIALFSRYADSDGRRLRMAAEDLGPAMAYVEEERDRVANEVSGRNSLALLRVLESLAAAPPDAVQKGTDAEASAESESEDAGSASDAVAMQQRIYTLEDQLEAAEANIADLSQRLAQYESYEVDEPADDESDEPEPASALDVNRHAAVSDAITDAERFPRLRFLNNCHKDLANYGKPRPNGVEIVKALNAINQLAQAWYNTPNGNIGPWDNYFISLTGWKHADDESDLTMSRYGEKRSFSDQEKGRQVTITRHLTYQGSGGGLQIYFDRDDVTDRFIVGYIGEHLPYATSPS